jgi:hypothetical protein
VIAAPLQHSNSILRARHTGAPRRQFMTIFATLMLTAIALYVLLQMDDLRS